MCCLLWCRFARGTLSSRSALWDGFLLGRWGRGRRGRLLRGRRQMFGRRGGVSGVFTSSGTAALRL